jgi:hypothetical protein
VSTPTPITIDPQDLFRETQHFFRESAQQNLTISTKMASIEGKLDGFLAAQNSMRGDIDSLKTRVSVNEGDIRDLKTAGSKLRGYVIGFLGIVSPAIGYVMATDFAIFKYFLKQ